MLSLSNLNALTDLFIRFSALNKSVPLAWRALLSNEISCKISIVKARSLRKFLLQRRTAIPENFVLDVKYLYRPDMYATQLEPTLSCMMLISGPILQQLLTFVARVPEKY